MHRLQMIFAELMGVSCFLSATGLLIGGKVIGLSEGVAGPAIGGLFVTAGLCYVAAAIDRLNLGRSPTDSTDPRPNATDPSRE